MMGSMFKNTKEIGGEQFVRKRSRYKTDIRFTTVSVPDIIFRK